jgi:mannose-1-phosphate guanylyltransferase
MRAMILAAGLGTRMAPLTERVPKPALPVLGEPMILRMIRQLTAQGIERIVVNVHAHADVMAQAVASAPRPVELSVEKELLGSLGGIRAARRHLDGQQPFLVLNADMVVDVDLVQLARVHRESRALATLVLREDPRKHAFGTIGYQEDGAVRRITDQISVGSVAGEKGSGLFTGIQLLSPEILERLPERPVSHLFQDLYVPLLREGARVFAAHMDPADAWWPVGTPRELLDANLLALDAELTRRGSPPDAVLADSSARIEGQVVGPAWIGPGARVPPGARLGPRVVLDARAEVPDRLAASEMLFLGGSRPQACEPLRRAIAYDREVWRDA